VWLVSRRNQPARYILCESFLVDDVGERSRNWLRNFAAGSRGHAFSPPVIIDGERWFKKPRRTTGNFAFGLQLIHDADIVRGLLSIGDAQRARRGSSPKSTD
jgi:hypothetical protein